MINIKQLAFLATGFLFMPAELLAVKTMAQAKKDYSEALRKYINLESGLIASDGSEMPAEKIADNLVEQIAKNKAQISLKKAEEAYFFSLFEVENEQGFETKFAGALPPSVKQSKNSQDKRWFISGRENTRVIHYENLLKDLRDKNPAGGGVGEFTDACAKLEKFLQDTYAERVELTSRANQLILEACQNRKEAFQKEQQAPQNNWSYLDYLPYFGKSWPSSNQATSADNKPMFADDPKIQILLSRQRQLANSLQTAREQRGGLELPEVVLKQIDLDEGAAASVAVEDASRNVGLVSTTAVANEGAVNSQPVAHETTAPASVVGSASDEKTNVAQTSAKQGWCASLWRSLGYLDKPASTSSHQIESPDPDSIPTTSVDPESVSTSVNVSNQQPYATEVSQPPSEQPKITAESDTGPNAVVTENSESNVVDEQPQDQNSSESGQLIDSGGRENDASQKNEISQPDGSQIKVPPPSGTCIDAALGSNAILREDDEPEGENTNPDANVTLQLVTPPPQLPAGLGAPEDTKQEEPTIPGTPAGSITWFRPRNIAILGAGVVATGFVLKVMYDSVRQLRQKKLSAKKLPELVTKNSIKTLRRLTQMPAKVGAELRRFVVRFKKWSAARFKRRVKLPVQHKIMLAQAAK